GFAAGGHYDPGHTNKHLGPLSTAGHRGDLPVLVVDSRGDATEAVNYATPTPIHSNGPAATIRPHGIAHPWRIPLRSQVASPKVSLNALSPPPTSCSSPAPLATTVGSSSESSWMRSPESVIPQTPDCLKVRARGATLLTDNLIGRTLPTGARACACTSNSPD